MSWRVISFLACQLGGALLGYLLGRLEGALAGTLLGTAGWFLLDLLRGLRMLRWLRTGADPAAAPAGGLWGELGDRVRRSLRTRDQAAAEAERRLQEFLAAIQASPNGVILLDPEGRIEWSNLTAAEHLGIDPKRDLLQHIGNLLRDPDFNAYYASGHYGREVLIPARDSTPGRPRKLSVQLHPYGNGRKLLLSRDVTGVEQAEVMRRDFVANVSHEIRTPLTVLAGFVETLQNLSLPPEEQARYLAMMAQQAQRMQGLVSDLLTLSRLEGSPLPGALEWSPLALFAAQAEDEGRGLIAALGKSQQLRFEPPPALELSGAAHELHSAMANLVTNAVRYTPSGGSIEVRWLVLQDGRVEFSVTDSGPGIAPEHLPRLTERFYRVDRSRSRDTGGTGLGLAIVKHVAQRHGAELAISSTLGVGSRFALTFPASRLRPQAASSPAARPATESAAG
ncbi:MULTISPECIES: phosphate regulon sensor histidine kinase PhoR [Ramlibacter]|uniref:Phosphate regulon sensor protein PhoR n=1 Tax=Ramlibacter aquaticus TaxID=2780094 RepID=A0ABR9SDA4_9BURK|nr:MULTISPECIES: phosphate regulon sensor histidine kinase PhoR [Ramlibacter]MBE7940199.1 phosphate regulon sensor histidine kinase PhoR [Ramlibacter aquaticus]